MIVIMHELMGDQFFMVSFSSSNLENTWILIPPKNDSYPILYRISDDKKYPMIIIIIIDNVAE